MEGIEIRSFREADRSAVVALWRATDLLRPWNDPDRDIDRKLALDDGLLLVAEDASARRRLVATVMAGYDGHRGWLYYLAVDPDLQGRGLGRLLVDEAEGRLLALGCPKVNLMVRRSNPSAEGFYRSLGYRIDEVTALGKRLIPDD